MRLSRRQRQDIVSDYLTSTGRPTYRPEEFIGWLAERPSHPAYGWFQWNDEEAANAYRIDQARSFVSDLRITYTTEAIRRGKIVVTAGESPAMVSPIGGHRTGGGYIPVRIDDPIAMEALCQEADRALDAWLRRYDAALRYRGIDPGGLRAVAKALGEEPKEAAA